jgi:regulator-associated protein of mTOR
MYELMHWLFEPSVYVFDCNGAGHMSDWYQHALSESSKSTGNPLPSSATLVGMSVIFCSCSKSETLPANPKWPADVFSACLTTPIRMALLWHVQQHRNLLTAFPNAQQIIEEIPGQLENRRTPLGELSWIFTAITDAIAYQLCSPDMFQKLFREDTLLASLCRNFLLAERVMRGSSATPSSFPALPKAAQHPLWLAWDLEIERCIATHVLKVWKKKRDLVANW